MQKKVVHVWGSQLKVNELHQWWSHSKPRADPNKIEIFEIILTYLKFFVLLWIFKQNWIFCNFVLDILLNEYLNCRFSLVSRLKILKYIYFYIKFYIAWFLIKFSAFNCLHATWFFINFSVFNCLHATWFLIKFSVFNCLH